jgi:site-specific recombinase XerD
MVKRVLPRACRKTGLDRTIQWHVLRHTFASHLVMRGEPLKVVQELMGHANIEVQ